MANKCNGDGAVTDLLEGKYSELQVAGHEEIYTRVGVISHGLYGHFTFRSNEITSLSYASALGSCGSSINNSVIRGRYNTIINRNSMEVLRSTDSRVSINFGSIG